MSKPIEVTDDTFEEKVLKSSIPVIVDFWAEWCPPCKMIAPFLREIAEEYDGRVSVCKVDVDNNQETAKKYRIQSIPTLLFVSQGEIRDQVIGAMPKDQITTRIDALLS